MFLECFCSVSTCSLEGKESDMTRIAFSLTIAALASLLAAGNLHAGETTDEDADVKPLVLCGKCGQVKGTDACCKAGQKTCAGCKLQKGSPGCCAVKKGTDAKICTECGEVKGAAKCCKAEGRKKCEACGFLAGSPGCKANCRAKGAKICAACGKPAGSAACKAKCKAKH